MKPRLEPPWMGNAGQGRPGESRAVHRLWVPWPLLLLSVLTLAGCGNGAAETSEASVSSLSYCDPAQDPAFELTHQDEAFNHYSGARAIRGVVYQEAPDTPLTFHTQVNQACRFEITRGFEIQTAAVLQDFEVEDAWAATPSCEPAQGRPALQGSYTILVNGFKVSRAFLDRYDPRRILSGMEMSRYTFVLDYASIRHVHQPSQVVCPQVVY
jgi:hypothetical protein